MLRAGVVSKPMRRGSGTVRPAPTVRLTVRARPRAKTSRVVQSDGLHIEVALAAAPVEGAANLELLSLLADALCVPRKVLRLAQGAASRNKVVEVLGLEPHEVVARLSAAVRR